MVTLREVLYDCRLGLVTRLTRTVLLVGALLFSYAIGTFLVSATSALHSGLRGDADRVFVPIIDSLADPAAFEEYNSTKESTVAVAAFANALTHDLQGGTYLTTFDQPVSVASDTPFREFAVGPDGLAGEAVEYDHPILGRSAFDVLSLQINKQAWQFYGLKTTSDEGQPDWSAINYSSDAPNPLIVGANYQGVVNIGDEIKIGFYNKELTFRVHGFLPERTMIYYKGNFNFSLDDMMVIPYPEEVVTYPLDQESELEFYRILSFAMVSGEIALEPGQTFDSIANEVAHLGLATKFPHYTFLGVSDYLTQYRLVRNLVMNNTSLIIATAAAIVFVVLAIAAWTSTRLARLRRTHQLVMWHIGITREDMSTVHLLSSCSYWTLAVALFALAISALPGHEPLSLIFVVAAFVGYCTGEYRLEQALTKRRLQRDAS